MPAWLQMLIVCALAGACALYSLATLLPRSARVGVAQALARWLAQPGPTPRRRAELRAALEAYARRHGTAACGGCSGCASRSGPAAGGSPAAQAVHWPAQRRTGQR